MKEVAKKKQSKASFMWDKRDCLRCDKRFSSAGFHNRICPQCQITNLKENNKRRWEIQLDFEKSKEAFVYLPMKPWWVK